MRSLARFGPRVVITAALFLLLFRPSLFGLDVAFIPVSLADLRAEVAGVEGGRFWTWVTVALVLKAVAIGASIGKWGLLLRAQAIRLSVASLGAIFLMGRFFGTFLPGTIGLDGFRLYEVARRTGRGIESATVIVFDKLAGFIALTLLVAVTLPLGYEALIRHQGLAPGLLRAVVASFALAAGAALVFLGFPRLLAPPVAWSARWLPGRVGTLLRRVVLAGSAYQGRPSVVLGALALGLVNHLATSLVYFATAMALATEGLALRDILFAAPLMIFGTVLGPSVGGEGIREAVFVYLLGPTTGPAKAFLWSHLGFWVEGTFALLGGAAFLVRPGRRREVGTTLPAPAGLPSTPPDAGEPR